MFCRIWLLNVLPYMTAFKCSVVLSNNFVALVAARVGVEWFLLFISYYFSSFGARWLTQTIKAWFKAWFWHYWNTFLTTCRLRVYEIRRVGLKSWAPIRTPTVHKILHLLFGLLLTRWYCVSTMKVCKVQFPSLLLGIIRQTSTRLFLGNIFSYKSG